MKRTLLFYLWKKNSYHLQHKVVLFKACTSILLLLTYFAWPIQEIQAQDNASNSSIDTITVLGKRNLPIDSVGITIYEGLAAPTIEDPQLDSLTYEQELVIPLNINSDSPLDYLTISIDGRLRYDLNAAKKGKIRGPNPDIIDLNMKVVKIRHYEGALTLKFSDYGEGTHTIKIVATNEYSASPTIINKLWEWKDPRRNPKLYALIMGVSNYAKDTLGGEQDAKRFYDEVILKSMGKQYEVANVILLKEQEVNEQRIKEIVRSKHGFEGIESNDIIVVYFAGHGLYNWSNKGNGETYLLPASYIESSNPEENYSQGIRLEADIITPLESIGCKIIGFIDACQTLGGTRSTAAAIPWFGKKVVDKHPDFTRLNIETNTKKPSNSLNDYSDYLVRDYPNKTILFFATSPGKIAHEYKNRSGYFTNYIIDAFSGSADYSGDGLLFPSEIDYFLKTRYYIDGQTPRSDGVYYKLSEQVASIRKPCEYYITKLEEDIMPKEDIIPSPLVNIGNDTYEPIPYNHSIPRYKEVFLGIDYPIGKASKTILPTDSDETTD